MNEFLPTQKTLLTAAIFLGVAHWVPVHAQESRWATPEDPTAKQLIAWERQWAEAGCTHNGIQKIILADDFQGTAPDGSLYSKKQALAEALSGKRTEEGCTMFDVKVHLFGETMALLYGSESAIHTETDGRKHTIKLTWTDTWLKRNGTWQIVAAQDMPSEVK
jgi:hypothetical protein